MSTPFFKRYSLRFAGLVALVIIATVLGLALLINIFQRKQEARNPFFRVVELNDDTVDPSIWGKNFPLQYDDYLKTIDQVRTRLEQEHLVEIGHCEHRAGRLNEGAGLTVR